PDPADERALLVENRTRGAVAPVMPPETLVALQNACNEVRLDASLADYLLALVRETREASDVELGASTRGALALKRAAQGFALVRGRDYVVPDDIQAAAESVLAHRIVLKRAEGGAREKALYIRKLLERIEAPV